MERIRSSLFRVNGSKAQKKPKLIWQSLISMEIFQIMVTTRKRTREKSPEESEVKKKKEEQIEPIPSTSSDQPMEVSAPRKKRFRHKQICAEAVEKVFYHLLFRFWPINLWSSRWQQPFAPSSLPFTRSSRKLMQQGHLVSTYSFDRIVFPVYRCRGELIMSYFQMLHSLPSSNASL